MRKAISLVSFVFLLTIFVGPIYAEIETRDMDSTTTDYLNGTLKFTSMPMWINNGTDYVPYILTENATVYKIETQKETLVFNKIGCNAILYNGTQMILDSDSSIIHQKDLTTNSTWQYITDVNDALCTITIYEDTINNSIILESNKTSTNLATFSTKYIKNDNDNGFKLLLSVTNENPSWTNNTMGFIETIHVPTNEVTLNGTVYDIPSNNGTFFDHSFFNDTRFTAIKLGDQLQYRTDDGLLNLWGATLLYENNTSKISFDYSFNDVATPVGEVYEIDPTFVSGGAQRGTVDNDGDNVCEDVGSSAYIDDSAVGLYSHGDIAVNAPLVDCWRSSLTVDITSIPNTVQSVDSMSITLTPSIIRTAQNHFFYNMPNNAGSLSLADHFDQINSGQLWANALVNSNPEVVDLGTGTGKADLLTILQTDSQEFISIGMSQNGIAAGIETGFDNAGGSLSITYTLAAPPDKPLNVDATNNRDGKIRLTWDANNAANVTNYDIFSSDDYSGPFTLLDTIGNFTTFAHTGLGENFEQYYKISAWFNPNGTNSTIVFGTSGNPFVNDTSAAEIQWLWMGDSGDGYDTIRMRQTGTGATCPDITGPSSVTVSGATTIKLYDVNDNLGCEFTAYTMDRTTTPQFLLPQFFEDYLDRIRYLIDFGSTTLNIQCEYKSVSNADGAQVDPRLNLTRAYQLATDATLDRDLTSNFFLCLSAQTQIPNIVTGKGGNDGVTLYRDSMAFNSSFFAFVSGVSAESRDSSNDRNTVHSFFQRMEFVNPTFSKIWNIQEHPKFDDQSLTEANAKETFDGKFNLNTFADNTDRGQIVMFKEFNKTQTNNIVYDAEDRGVDGVNTFATNAAFGQRVTISESFTVDDMEITGSNGDSFFIAGSVTGGTAQYFIYDPSQPSGQRYVQNSTSSTAIISGGQKLTQDFTGSIVHPSGEYVFGIRFDGFTRTGSTGDSPLRCQSCSVTGGSVEINNWKTTAFGGASATQDFGAKVIGITTADTTPNIRVTGTYQTNTVSPDVNLRFEIKDGGYAIGQVIGNSEDVKFFPVNEFDIYQDGGSLGVVHSSPIGTGVESFDITITPNWSNSTSDIFTVFVGLDDNSTTSNLSANITNFYIEDTLAQDFEDLGYVQYYEVSTGALCDTSSTGCITARSYYNSGLVLAEQVGSISVSDETLPTPPTPTFANVTGFDFTALTIEWNQSLINTTDFQISRELGIGGGFVKLADTNNVTKIYEDTGLSTGTEYNYEICAINGEQIETTCITASATTLGLPFSAPQNLAATNNLLTQIDLTWDAENATGVTGYTIYNSSTGSIPFDIVGDNSDNSTTFSDLGLPNNFDMFYKVSAFGTGNTNGTNSTVAMGSTIQPGQPVNIDNVNATAILPFDVFLEWADSGINITDYKIDRNGTEIIASLLIEHGNITTKAFIDNSTSLGTNFLYNVSGINAPNGSLSIIGNPTTSNLVKTNDVPSQVLNVVADLVNFFTLNQIELDWTQANNGSGNPLGVGVNLTETRIYSKNITDGGDFILTTTLLAASPPPIEYNDTNIIVPNDYSYMLSSCNVLGCGPNSTEVLADSIDFPDAIFDLLFYGLNFQSLILNWTQPFLGGGSLQDGYQVNFTTPFEDPLTIIVADTESTFTEYTISGLTQLTNYSFRVSAINQAGLNVSGLILNITTPEDFTEENFTVGFVGEFPDAALDETNLDIIPIRFERIDINDTTVRLNVTYANNIDLACSFDYKFAMTESFFDSPLDTVNIGGGDQETSFLFTDFDNEVVDVFCWNEVANQTAVISGSYILTQTNFPLLQQIADFRAGEFGTDGMFGVLDMITLMVIIISMIGFNRVNETVGAIFNIIFIGSLSFFGIIELSTTIFSAVALVLMLVIISTRKV